jgi:hypothetical protein
MAIRFGGGVVFGDVTPGGPVAPGSLGVGVSLVQQAQAQASTPTGSVLFNGSNQRLTVPSNAGFNFGTGDFTVEAWVYMPTISGNQNILIYAWGATNSTSSFQIYTSSGVVTGYVFNGSSSPSANGPSNLIAGQWNHIALVRNSNNLTVYINGVGGTSVNIGSISLNDNASSVFYAGCNYGPGNYFSGYISNLRVVKGTAVYTTNFTPSTTPLTAVTGTQLLTCQSSSSITDASTNALTITNNGTAVASSSNPFIGGSVSFNGTNQSLTVPANNNLTLSGNFTVEGWVYLNSVSAAQPIMAYGTSGSATNLLFLFNPTVGLRWYYSGATSDINQGSTAGWASNTWYHIAAVRNGSTITLYRNGTSVASGTASTTYGSGFTLSVGGSVGDSVYFNGNISNFRVVNGTAVYTANFTPSTTPLTAIAGTALLTCQSATSATTDASSYNIALTNVGSATATGLSPFSIVGTAVTQTYVPDSPNILSVVGSTSSVAVVFEPPAFNGGSTITSFTVTLISSANTSTSTVLTQSVGSTVTFSGLPNSTYTARAYATNAVGTSVASYPYSDITGTKLTAQLLAVAGGGGGGGGAGPGDGGGGGGGGGLLYGSTSLIAGSTYTVTVGAGGTGGTGNSAPGNPGSNSMFASFTAIGGGGGATNSFNPASATAYAGKTGGSGGGGTGGGPQSIQGAGGLACGSSGAGLAGTQGYPGGKGWPSGQYGGGGGGGGATSAGGDSAPGGRGGPGGSGYTWTYTGSTYAGGGGGATDYAGGTLGVGGPGGGGNGGSYTGTLAVAGTAGTGGGGGGSHAPVASGGNGGLGGGGVVAVAYQSATQQFQGGTMTPGSANPAAPGYYVHAFTSSGSLSPYTPPTTVTAQYLVVAGGAGGGDNCGGGGGGAGGLLVGSASLVIGSAYTITVGSGGAGGAPNTGRGSNGGTSSLSGSGITTVTATGGGGGGGGCRAPAAPPGVAQPGGSGGGSGFNGSFGTGTPGQGYPGSGATNNGVPGGFLGGAGGGAGGAGVSPSPTSAGAGGAGYTWTYTGSTYAGGGGGAAVFGGKSGGAGGAGGGGSGVTNPGGCGGLTGGAGGAGTGGGGGGGTSSPGNGGAGGSGVVILAVPTAGYPGSAPGATVSTPGSAPGMTVLKYTSSGSYTA